MADDTMQPHRKVIRGRKQKPDTPYMIERRARFRKILARTAAARKAIDRFIGKTKV